MRDLLIRFRFQIFFALIAVAVPTLSWLLFGRSAAEKIVTALALPCGVIWWTMLLCAAWLWNRRQRQGSVMVFLLWLMYSIGGSGFVSDALSRSLERPYLKIDPLAAAPMDAIVLLGGGGSLGGNRRVQANGAGDRIVVAAQVYHRGLTAKIICTGQRIESMDSTGVDPSEVGESLLISLNVPAEAIERLGGENTSQEMRQLGERFGDGESRVGLVTSAWHLPRAMRLADRNGFHPVPLPADFRTGPDVKPMTMAQRVTSIIPTGDAFAANCAFAKEYLGRAVGR